MLCPPSGSVRSNTQNAVLHLHALLLATQVGVTALPPVPPSPPCPPFPDEPPDPAVPPIPALPEPPVDVVPPAPLPAPPPVPPPPEPAAEPPEPGEGCWVSELELPPHAGLQTAANETTTATTATSGVFIFNIPFAAPVSPDKIRSWYWVPGDRSKGRVRLRAQGRGSRTRDRGQVTVQATDIDAQLHFCPDNVGSSTLAWLKSALAAKIADAVGQGIKSGIETGGCRSTMQDAGTSDAQ